MRSQSWGVLFIGFAILIVLGFTSTAIVLLASPMDTGTCSSPSGLEIVSSNGSEELTIVRCDDTAEGQVLKRLTNEQIGWADDGVTADVTGSAATVVTTLEVIDDPDGCVTIAGATLTIDVDCIRGP